MAALECSASERTAWQDKKVMIDNSEVEERMPVDYPRNCVEERGNGIPRRMNVLVVVHSVV